MKYIYTIFLSTVFYFCSAQEILDPSKKWSLTFSPSAFVNEFPGIQFGIERKIKRFAIEIEGAYLTDKLSDTRMFTNGYRVKLGIKYSLYNALNINLIGFYRQTYHDESETFSMFSGAYFQEIAFQREKRMIGPTLGCTYKKNLWKNLSIEVGGSTGLGSIKVTQADIPEFAEQITSLNDALFFNEFNEPGTFRYLILSGQAKIKYNF